MHSDNYWTGSFHPDDPRPHLGWNFQGMQICRIPPWRFYVIPHGFPAWMLFELELTWFGLDPRSHEPLWVMTDGPSWLWYATLHSWWDRAINKLVHRFQMVGSDSDPPFWCENGYRRSYNEQDPWDGMTAFGMYQDQGPPYYEPGPHDITLWVTPKPFWWSLADPDAEPPPTR